MSNEKPGRDQELYDPDLDGPADSKMIVIPSEHRDFAESRDPRLDMVQALNLVIWTYILFFISPIILLAMILVRLTSRGPGIVAHRRVGQFGRVFTIYKIRTMYQDREGRNGLFRPAIGDCRITPIGRFLRWSHMDELPQLINVLRGEMSLVGPRPERPEFLDEFERAIPNYHLRLAVRPGLTGLAQVLRPPDTNAFSVRRRLALDLDYVSRANLWLDLRILLATGGKAFGLPPAVLAALVGRPVEVE